MAPEESTAKAAIMVILVFIVLRREISLRGLDLNLYKIKNRQVRLRLFYPRGFVFFFMIHSRSI